MNKIVSNIQSLLDNYNPYGLTHNEAADGGYYLTGKHLDVHIVKHNNGYKVTVAHTFPTTYHLPKNVEHNEGKYHCIDYLSQIFPNKLTMLTTSVNSVNREWLVDNEEDVVTLFNCFNINEYLGGLVVYDNDIMTEDEVMGYAKPLIEKYPGIAHIERGSWKLITTINHRLVILSGPIWTLAIKMGTSTVEEAMNKSFEHIVSNHVFDRLVNLSLKEDSLYTITASEGPNDDVRFDLVFGAKDRIGGSPLDSKLWIRYEFNDLFSNNVVITTVLLRDTMDSEKYTVVAANGRLYQTEEKGPFGGKMHGISQDIYCEDLLSLEILIDKAKYIAERMVYNPYLVVKRGLGAYEDIIVNQLTKWLNENWTKYHCENGYFTFEAILNSNHKVTCPRLTFKHQYDITEHVIDIDCDEKEGSSHRLVLPDNLNRASRGVIPTMAENNYQDAVTIIGHLFGEDYDCEYWYNNEHEGYDFILERTRGEQKAPGIDRLILEAIDNDDSLLVANIDYTLSHPSPLTGTVGPSTYSDKAPMKAFPLTIPNIVNYFQTVAYNVDSIIYMMEEIVN